MPLPRTNPLASSSPSYSVVAAGEPHQLAYTVPQALEVVPIGRSYLYEEIKAGRLRATKVGKRILIRRQALADWLALCERETAEASESAEV